MTPHNDPHDLDATTPAVTDEAPWPSDQARDLAVAACYDCHSDHTTYPWYSYITPVNFWM